MVLTFVRHALYLERAQQLVRMDDVAATFIVTQGDSCLSAAADYWD